MWKSPACRLPTATFFRRTVLPASMVISVSFPEAVAAASAAAVDSLTGGMGVDLLDGGDGSDGGASDTDRLVVGAGIDPSSVVVGRSSLANSDLVLQLANGQSIVLQDQLSGQPGAGLEEIRFADNTIWSRSDILSHLDPHLIIGSANNAALTGSEGADTFVAGSGNEMLSGYSGSDVYRISASTGNDVIVEGSAGGTDRIELVGLNRSDVQFSRSGTELLIKITATGQTITVSGQFGLTSAGVEEIVFADATVWSRAQSGKDKIDAAVEDAVVHRQEVKRGRIQRNALNSCERFRRNLNCP
jgi:hypothetical protein